MSPKSFNSSADGVEIEAIHKYQPPFPRGLYRLIYEYHTDVGASWFNAWDVMTGEGFLAIELAKYFNTVWATDPSPAKIAQAVEYLSEQPHAHNKVTFAVRRPEDGLPTASQLDTVAVGNNIHTTADPDKVVREICDNLKANGTLAMWVCGMRPYFVEPQHKLAQKVFDEAFRKWMSASWGKTASHEAQVLASRLDSIELKDLQWEHVRRIHWNRERSMVGEPDSRVPTLPSKVKKWETVENHTNDEFMTVEADLDWIINYMNTLNPNVSVEEVCGEQLIQLEQELGSRTKRVKIGWPLTLILATKR